MRRRYFHCAGTELGLRQFIGNDRNLAIHQRQQNFLPMQVRIAFVFGIHSDGRIAQHGLRTSRRHRDEFRTPHHRITDLPQLAHNFFVLHFDVRDCGPTIRTPVHDVLPAINQPFLIQPDEYLAHRPREILVHGEVLAVPVHRRAQPLHLVENRATVELLPLPHPLDKLLPPHRDSRLALAAQLPIHHHLRGDAGVIGPGQPQRDEAAHAMPAHNDVHLRLVQHVSHVQTPRHIRRRQQQREHRTRLIF